MSAEREQIDRMQGEGKITPEEAQRLRAALDKAESVAPTTPAQNTPAPRMSRLSIAGALGFPAAMLASLLVFMALASVMPAYSDGPFWPMVVVFSITGVGLAFLLTGFILSIAALVAIKNSKGRLTGRGLALFGIIAPAVIVLLAFTFFFFKAASYREPVAANEVVYTRGPDLGDVPQTLFMELQAAFSKPAMGVSAIAKLAEPSWADELRSAQKVEDFNRLVKGTIFGCNPEQKEIVRQGVFSVRYDSGVDSATMYVESKGTSLLIPIVRISGKWYFANKPFIQASAN